MIPALLALLAPGAAAYWHSGWVWEDMPVTWCLVEPVPDLERMTADEVRAAVHAAVDGWQAEPTGLVLEQTFGCEPNGKGDQLVQLRSLGRGYCGHPRQREPLGHYDGGCV